MLEFLAVKTTDLTDALNINLDNSGAEDRVQTEPPKSQITSSQTKPNQSTLEVRKQNAVTEPSLGLNTAELFKKHEVSVWQIIASDNPTAKPKDMSFSMGSAVAISPSKLQTNCHVIKNSKAVFIVKDKKVRNAKLVNGDVKADACVLKITETDLVPVQRSRPYANLKVGEKVYSIGSPKGLTNTLGEGIISGLRAIKGRKLIQTTAQISSGSSGGGLFDAQGNLIGITTFGIVKSDGLNFAISEEEYSELPRLELLSMPASDDLRTSTAESDERPNRAWETMDSAWNSYTRGEYKIALNQWMKAGEAGIPLGHHNAGVLISMGKGAPMNVDKSMALFHKSIKMGMVGSQYNLARLINYKENPLAFKNSYQLIVDEHPYPKITLNLPEVRKLIFKAADNGHIKSSEILGNAYRYGLEGLPKIVELAANYKKKRIQSCAKRINKPYPKGSDVSVSQWASIFCEFPDPLKTPLRNCPHYEPISVCRNSVTG